MKWFLLEEIPKSTWLMSVFPVSGWADLSHVGVESNNELSIVTNEGGTDRLYFVRERMEASSKWILHKILAQPSWAEQLNAKIIEFNDGLFAFDLQLGETDVTKASDAHLSEIYSRHCMLQKESHVAGMPWNTLEFDKPLFSDYLLDYLKNQAAAAQSAVKPAEAFSILTTPLRESFAQKEEKEILAIAAQMQQDENALKLFRHAGAAEIERGLESTSPATYHKLMRHFNEFCWLPYMYEGPAWDLRYFIEILQGLVRQNDDCAALYRKALSQKGELAQRQAQLSRELQIDLAHDRLFAIARDIVFTKGYRKDCIYHGFYCLEPLFIEAAKRLGITLAQLRHFTPYELEAAIASGKADARLLDQRAQFSLYYTGPDHPAGIALSGAAAREFFAKLDVEKADNQIGVKELKGNCACPGHARGIVKIVQRSEDMAKMENGNILVAHSTNPDIVPAMKKAGAIVTDLGGITCHAAIVSRELRIPCVVGTKNATKVLVDGDLVEVDATHGTVRKL